MITLFLGCDSSDSVDPQNDPNWIHVSDIGVHFSPKSGIDDLIIFKIAEAKTTLDIAIYDLTNSSIANAVVAAKNRGVAVRVYIEDNSLPSELNCIEILELGDIEIKRSNPEEWVPRAKPEERVESFLAIMHNKFIVIDQKVVITGSYNFTGNAEKNNRENVLVIPNTIIAEQYQEQFNYYWTNP